VTYLKRWKGGKENSTYLPALQLDQILRVINQIQRRILIPLPNLPRLEPPVLREDRVVLIRIRAVEVGLGQHRG
jgi:hypothetical protein